MVFFSHDVNGIISLSYTFNFSSNQGSPNKLERKPAMIPLRKYPIGFPIFLKAEHSKFSSTLIIISPFSSSNSNIDILHHPEALAYLAVSSTICFFRKLEFTKFAKEPFC